MRRLAWVLVVAACGCGGDGGGDDDVVVDARPTADGRLTDGGPATADAQVTSMTVGPGGGTVTTPDGVVLIVPAGALADDTAITVTRVADAGMGTVGPVFELGPDGTAFAAPVTLTLPYDPALAGASELMLATEQGGGWSSQGYAVVDSGTQTVSGHITHFSRWAIVPSAGPACTLNYGCFTSCCGAAPPLQCCNGARSTCWCTGGADFPDFVGCYAACVGAPLTTNFANDECMSGCCTAQGGTANNGACMIDSAAAARAVLDCGAGCFGPGDQSTICSSSDLTFDACTWNANMTPGFGDDCVGPGMGVNSQFLRTAGTTILPQTWGGPPVADVTGGSYGSTSLGLSVSCANGVPVSGSMNATFSGGNFIGTWTFGMSSGNVTISPAW